MKDEAIYAYQSKTEFPKLGGRVGTTVSKYTDVICGITRVVTNKEVFYRAQKLHMLI